MTAAIVLAVVITSLALGAAIPWRLELAAEVRGEPDGAWAIAGGGRLSLFAASFARARGTPLVVEIRALGRLLVRRLYPSPEASAAPALEPAPAAPTRSLRARYDALARRVDPLDLALFVLGETRRVALRDLEGSVSFGLRDVDLAGRIAGALAVISALGRPLGRLRHQVDWSGREHLEASLSFKLRFTPALFVWDVARFAARSFRARRARRAPSTSATTPAHAP